MGGDKVVRKRRLEEKIIYTYFFGSKASRPSTLYCVGGMHMIANSLDDAYLNIDVRTYIHRGKASQNLPASNLQQGCKYLYSEIH